MKNVIIGFLLFVLLLFCYELYTIEQDVMHPLHAIGHFVGIRRFPWEPEHRPLHWWEKEHREHHHGW